MSRPAEMTVQDLKEMLREHIVEVRFTKADGTERTMMATTRKDVVIPYENKTGMKRVKPEHLVSAWDTEIDEWRTINFNTVKYVSVTRNN